MARVRTQEKLKLPQIHSITVFPDTFKGNKDNAAYFFGSLTTVFLSVTSVKSEHTDETSYHLLLKKITE